MNEYFTAEELREVARLFVDLCDAPSDEKMAILGAFDRFPAYKFANYPWVDPPSINKTSSAKRKYRDHVESWLDGRHSDPARVEKLLRSTAILNLAGEIALDDDVYSDDIIHRDRTTQLQHLREHEEWSLSLRYVDRSTCATKGCETAWLHLGDVRAYADDLEADGWRLVTAKGGKYLAHDASLSVVRVQNASARHCCDTHRKLSSANPDGKTRTTPIKESTRQTYEKELVQEFKNTFDPFQNSLG